MRRPYTSRHNGYPTSRINDLPVSTGKYSNSSLWKSPIVAGTVLVGIVAFAVVAYFSLTTQPVISVLANDVSDSARAYPQLSKNACKARNNELEPGDIQIDAIYADFTEFRKDTKVNNKLSLMRQCSNLFDDNDRQPESGIRKSPGTSLEVLLDSIQTKVSSKRAKGILFPAVITVTLHENEPVPGQPTPDMRRIKDKISNLTRDNQGIIVISGPTGQLQAELIKALEHNRNAHICPFSDIKSCTQRVFQEGRRLSLQ